MTRFEEGEPEKRNLCCRFDYRKGEREEREFRSFGFELRVIGV